MTVLLSLYSKNIWMGNIVVIFKEIHFKYWQNKYEMQTGLAGGEQIRWHLSCGNTISVTFPSSPRLPPPPPRPLPPRPPPSPPPPPPLEHQHNRYKISRNWIMCGQSSQSPSSFPSSSRTPVHWLQNHQKLNNLWSEKATLHMKIQLDVAVFATKCILKKWCFPAFYPLAVMTGKWGRGWLVVNIVSAVNVIFVILYCIVLYCIDVYCIILYCVVLYDFSYRLSTWFLFGRSFPQADHSRTLHMARQRKKRGVNILS